MFKQGAALQVSTAIGGCEALLGSATLEIIRAELASASDLHLPGLWQPSSLVSVYQQGVRACCMLDQVFLNTLFMLTKVACLASVCKPPM